MDIGHGNVPKKEKNKDDQAFKGSLKTLQWLSISVSPYSPAFKYTFVEIDDFCAPSSSTV